MIKARYHKIPNVTTNPMVLSIFHTTKTSIAGKIQKRKVRIALKILTGSFLPELSVLKFRSIPNGLHILRANWAIPTESKSDQNAEFR